MKPEVTLPYLQATFYGPSPQNNVPLQAHPLRFCIIHFNTLRTGDAELRF